MSVALQCAQTIMIFHRATALGWGSSCLTHIIANASPSISSHFVINESSFVLSFLCYVDCHFIAMSPLCISSLLDFCWYFAFVFSLGCLYLCFHLPCTFDGWVPILDFDLQGLSFV